MLTTQDQSPKDGVGSHAMFADKCTVTLFPLSPRPCLAPAAFTQTKLKLPCGIYIGSPLSMIGADSSEPQLAAVHPSAILTPCSKSCPSPPPYNSPLGAFILSYMTSEVPIQMLSVVLVAIFVVFVAGLGLAGGAGGFWLFTLCLFCIVSAG